MENSLVDGLEVWVKDMAQGMEVSGQMENLEIKHVSHECSDMKS